MKILIATGLYPPEIGGPATYVKMLEAELPKHQIEFKTIPFSEVRKYPKIVRHIAYFFLVLKYSKDVDLIYALDPVSVGLPAMLGSKITGKRFLLRLGGDYSWEQCRVRRGTPVTLDDYVRPSYKKPKLGVLLSFVQTLVAKQAVKVIVPSEYLKSIVIQWGVTDNHIQVIYSAYTPKKEQRSKEKDRAAIGYTYPTILSAGRLVPWKGFPVLIDVIGSLKGEYPNIKLLIAGDGDEQAALETQIKRLSLEDHVTLLGRVDKSQLAQYMNASDVFVLNTAYEGLSHQLLEVMDIGTPIITTLVGGNAELMNHSEHGLLVTYNDVEELRESIIMLLTNQNMAAHLVASAHTRVEDFKGEIVVKQLVQLLHTIHGATT